MLRLQCSDYSSGEWSWFLSSWKRFHPCKYQSDSSIKFNCLFNQCEKAFCPAALRESTKNFSKKFRPKTIKLVLFTISLIVNIGDFEFNALYFSPETSQLNFWKISNIRVSAGFFWEFTFSYIHAGLIHTEKTGGRPN